MNTERAPEPTMEEILASIRRIISDDEASSVQQRATGTEYAEQVRADEAEEGSADTQMIDHLARALGGGATPSAANDDDIEDILDLTEPGSAAAEDVMMADEPVTVLEEMVLESEVYVEARPKLDFAAAFPPQDQHRSESPPGFAEAPPAFEEASGDYEPPSSYEPPPGYEAPPPTVEMPAPEPVAARPMPTLNESATALERAIAALKAGDLAAFAREAQADYVEPAPAYSAPEPAYSAPEPIYSALEPEAAAVEPEPPLAAVEELATFEEETIIASESEPEAEPSVPAWAAETSSWSQMEEASEPEPELEPELEPLPWRSEDQSWRGATPANEFELNPGRVTNGGTNHETLDYEVPVSSKSLEDSVKEMLRPMLRQWLDENMPRVLTAALREELENSDYQRRDG